VVEAARSCQSDGMGSRLYPSVLLRAHSRLARRSSSDLRAIDRATKRIEELSLILDRQLSVEDRDEDRLKHLRQATGQITRCANDGIQAYRRISQALRAEASHADADPAEVADATRALADARARMLAALEVASRRYPWAEPWSSSGPE
jgi:hypothetical protein